MRERVLVFMAEHPGETVNDMSLALTGVDDPHSKDRHYVYQALVSLEDEGLARRERPERGARNRQHRWFRV